MLQVVLAHVLPASSLGSSAARGVTVTSSPPFAELARVSGYAPAAEGITYDFTDPSVATEGRLAYTNIVFLPSSAARFIGELAAFALSSTPGHDAGCFHCAVGT